eukprot:scaffold3766_cov289-Prasinococcus_capsulatus_cf.AAC.1
MVGEPRQPRAGGFILARGSHLVRQRYRGPSSSSSVWSPGLGKGCLGEGAAAPRCWPQRPPRQRSS